jgi:DNA-binding Lrp family transcriptional regulator
MSKKFEMSDLDQKDEIILACIKENPEATVKEIFERLDGEMPYPTVLKRVQHLTEIDVLRKSFLIDMKALRYTLHCRIDVLISPSELRQENLLTQKTAKDMTQQKPRSQKDLSRHIIEVLVMEDRFKDSILVKDIYILLGSDVDISLDVYAKDYQKITEFVTEGIRNIPGVFNTKTALLTWSVKQGNL